MCNLQNCITSLAVCAMVIAGIDTAHAQTTSTNVQAALAPAAPEPASDLSIEGQESPGQLQLRQKPNQSFEPPIVGKKTTDGAFGTPTGLSMSVPELLQRLGYIGCCNSTCYPLSAETSLQIGVKAFQYGLYQDAKAMAIHAAGLESRPEILFLKAMSELATNDCDQAIQTARKLRKMRQTNWLRNLRERLAGPLETQLQILVRDLPEELPTAPAPSI